MRSSEHLALIKIFLLISIIDRTHNKRFKACADAHWDTNTWVASHYTPCVCAP